MPRGIPNRTLDVKTPGAVTDPEDETKARDAELDAAADAAIGDTRDVALPQVAEAAQAPDLKAYIDAQIAKGIAAGMKTIQAAQSGTRPAVELPDQAAVDPKKIKDLTLSKQGYVIPAGYGAAPEHIRAQIQLGQPR